MICVLHCIQSFITCRKVNKICKFELQITQFPQQFIPSAYMNIKLKLINYNAGPNICMIFLTIIFYITRYHLEFHKHFVASSLVRLGSKTMSILNLYIINIIIITTIILRLYYSNYNKCSLHKPMLTS